MKKNLILVSIILTFLFLATMSANGAPAVGPFQVSAIPAEDSWESWGYVVDYQTWGNWFDVDIPWDTDAEMSGSYTIQSDFIFQVDPSTSGLADPSATYGEDFWNHDNVYGRGEFFDAGIDAFDQNYVFVLNLGATDTWEVFYDADRDQINDGLLNPTDADYIESEHAILSGTVLSYWDQGGYFYGILLDEDGIYQGYFTDTHDEGTPDLVNDVFHAGSGNPVPIPGAVWLLGSGLIGLVGLRRRKS